MEKRKTFSDECKEMAIGYGLCQQWTEEWADNSSYDEILHKYVKGIDFCLKHNIAPNDDYVKEFGYVTLHRNGIYYNESVDTVVNERFLSLSGHCTGTIDMNDGMPSEIYVRHTSEITLNVSNGSKVWLNLLDYTKVKIECDRFSKVFVHNYGEGEVEGEGTGISYKERKGFFGECKSR